MTKIIDFNEKVEERKKLNIIKMDNEIDILGWEGTLFIHFNKIETEKQKNKSILYQIIKCVKTIKKISKEPQVKEVTEEHCKEMVIDLMKRISWKGMYQEIVFKEVWGKIKEEVLKDKSFKYVLVEKNTLIGSYIFIIKESQK